MDRLINWLVSEASNLWTKVNPIVQRLLSETSCLATKINPMVQRSMSYTSYYLVTKINPIVKSFAQRKFSFNTKTFVGEITTDGDTLLRVAGAVAAIAVVRVLWKMVFKGSGKTMKAPGRNHRMLRKDFERSPKDYFRKLRK